MEGLAQDLKNNRHARLGVLDLYISDENTAYNAETGWEYLGVMDPGTFDPQFTKEVFSLETGFPRAIKMQAVTRVGGAVNFSLHEYNALAVELAAGSGAPTRTYATDPAATSVAAGTISVSSFPLTDATGYTVGNLIEVAGDQLTYIEAIDGTQITVKPELAEAPVATDTIKAIVRMAQALGSVELPRKAFKAVFTDQNGETVTIYLASVASVGNYRPNFADALSNVKMPVSLQAYGSEQTWQGRQQQIIGWVYHDLPNVS